MLLSGCQWNQVEIAIVSSGQWLLYKKNESTGLSLKTQKTMGNDKYWLYNWYPDGKATWNQCVASNVAVKLSFPSVCWSPVVLLLSRPLWQHCSYKLKLKLNRNNKQQERQMTNKDIYNCWLLVLITRLLIHYTGLLTVSHFTCAWNSSGCIRRCSSKGRERRSNLVSQL